MERLARKDWNRLPEKERVIAASGQHYVRRGPKLVPVVLVRSTTERGDGDSTCRQCGSEDLFSTWADRGGFTYDPADGGRKRAVKYKTFCQTCGHDQSKYPRGGAR